MNEEERSSDRAVTFPQAPVAGCNDAASEGHEATPNPGSAGILADAWRRGGGKPPTRMRVPPGGPLCLSSFPWFPSVLILLWLVFVTVSLSASETPAPTTPKHGGTLRLARLYDPVTLDAARMEMSEDFLLMPLIHQTLLDVKGGTNLVPGAARDWSTSLDKKVYTFRLRPGVRFSNGREAVASDYLFAIERTLNPATGAAMGSYLKGIRGVEGFTSGLTHHVEGISAPSSDTLVIELERPDPTFGFVLSSQAGVAVPPEEIARLGSRYSTEPVGTGPYLVRKWKRGARLQLSRNPFYCGLEGNRSRILKGIVREGVDYEESITTSGTKEGGDRSCAQASTA